MMFANSAKRISGAWQIEPIAQQLPRLLTQRLGHEPLDDDAGVEHGQLHRSRSSRNSVRLSVWGVSAVMAAICRVPLAKIGDAFTTTPPVASVHMADLSLQRSLVRLSLSLEPLDHPVVKITDCQITHAFSPSTAHVLTLC